MSLVGTRPPTVDEWEKYEICYKAKDIEKLGLDYVVVGSDEVWNYRETKGNARVKFGIGLNNERLVAYAPSVGQTHELNVPEYVKEGILQFKAVSARDQLTEQLAEEIRNEEIERVTDPTFLVHIPDEKVSSVSQPYMLFYYCDGLPEAEKQKLIDYKKLFLYFGIITTPFFPFGETIRS